MKLAAFPCRTVTRRSFAAAIFAALLMLALPAVLRAQSPQLSLADLLIGLRSKKVSLPERNKILTTAVKERGITFVLTPEISRELATTGASPELLDAILQKSPSQKTAAEPKPVPTPVPTPTPPGFDYYLQRADANAEKGQFETALEDYDKAAELKADEPSIYFGRAKAHFNMRSFDRSVADYGKSIELNPKDAIAFYNRGVSYERLERFDLAIADYRQSLILDPENEGAKSNLTRLEDLITKASAALKPAPKPEPTQDQADKEAKTVEPPAKEVAQPVAPPEFLNVGNLTAVNAVKMVMPMYSLVAQRSNISGHVTVNVELDEKGNVVSAEAVTGHQMLRSSAEDAAKKSRFKPYLYNNQPIKAKGVIVYNFSLKGTEE